MKKIIASLTALILLLAGCGSVDYTDPQIYIDKVVEEANNQSDTIKKGNEFLVLIDGEQNFQDLVDSYKNLIGVALSSVPDQAEAYYTEFALEIENEDFVSIEADLQEAIDTYNSEGEAAQNITAKITNGYFTVATASLNAVTTFAESDAFAQIVEASESIEELYDNVKAEMDAQ